MPDQNTGSNQTPVQTPAAESFNDKNVEMLRALVIVHALACGVWIVGVQLHAAVGIKASMDVLGITAQALSLTLLTLASLVTIALVNVVPTAFKHQLVFGRSEYPLPACRAFSVYARSDPRVNREALEQKYGPLPEEPLEQNKLWYGWLKTYEDRLPAIAYTSRVFLLLTNTAAVILVLMPVLFTILCLSGSPQAVLPVLAIMLAEFFVATVAARNAGISLVTDVLAQASRDAVRAQGGQASRPPKTRRTH